MRGKDIQELWDRALKGTEILRLRASALSAFDATAVPYVFLAESAVNPGDTVIRRGHVMIERPAIVLPGLSPQFEGFGFDADWRVSPDAVATFLLVRGVQFPSLRYRHELSSLDVREDSLAKAAVHFKKALGEAEDTKTGLILGPEDVWQFSILLLVGALVARSAEGDVRRLFEAWRRRQRES